MRSELLDRIGDPIGLTATVSRFATRKRHGKVIPTALLTNVIDTDRRKPIVDHIWIDRKYLNRLNERDVIQFTAIPRYYLKGYMGHRRNNHLANKAIRLDICLTQIQKVRKKGVFA